ncbi:imm11 family protein [Persicobacter psychrovividus]|uniref:Immunity MXAN-0049 protein domain-containing protein n=1 Tax=Persicobacter psychrovividus TaxID=387638 RepID=A0ABM7VD15_9BACT|nr:hypothetical protein PEPS_11180 [Persicobacter psychrovividus]
MEKVYKLKWDLDHSGDSEKDAFHFTFKNDIEFGADIISTRYFELPDEIYFQANFSIINEYDYLLNSLMAPVMSNRMLEIITCLGDTNIRVIPVIMISDLYPVKSIDVNRIKKSDNLVNFNFRIIQIMTYTDVFDYGNSEYDNDFILPVGNIHKLVLRKPLIGFPPIFRIKEKASEIFISQITKEALETANIKGCIFEPVETS